MAGASLLTLLDDIAAVLDDVSLMTKVAAKKTAGVLGDDLALNAQQVTGVNADRELPVVWAVIPLLMLGGAYLCFEGFEKIAHKYLPHDDEHADEAALAANVDVAALEKQKIGGAIRTDFILSAEIIAITLGTVAESSFTTQVLVLVGIALVMTIGVYGLVAGIVKLDDAGLYLSKRDSGFAQELGGAILRTAPYLMKGLSVVGMAAMFMVGGGILTHGIPVVHHAIEQAAQSVAGIATLGPLLAAITPTLLNFLFGIVAGAVVLAGVLLVKRLLPKKKKTG